MAMPTPPLAIDEQRSGRQSIQRDATDASPWRTRSTAAWNASTNARYTAGLPPYSEVHATQIAHLERGHGIQDIVAARMQSFQSSSFTRRALQS